VLAALAAGGERCHQGLPRAHRRRRRALACGAAGRQAARGSLVRRRALGATRVGRLPRPRGGHSDADARGSHRAVLRLLTMRLEVEHAFAFEYDGYISESFLELRVQPKTTPTQTVLSFTLAVGPRARVYRYVDWNDNVTHHFTITKFHDRIEVTATSLVETRPAPVALADLGPPAGAGEVPYPLLAYLAFDGPVRLTAALRAAPGARSEERRVGEGGEVGRGGERC